MESAVAYVPLGVSKALNVLQRICRPTLQQSDVSLERQIKCFDAGGDPLVCQSGTILDYLNYYLIIIKETEVSIAVWDGNIEMFMKTNVYACKSNN